MTQKRQQHSFELKERQQGLNALRQTTIEWRVKALQLLNTVQQHRASWAFLEPVTDAIAPFYSTIITEPTDLITIKDDSHVSKLQYL